MKRCLLTVALVVLAVALALADDSRDEESQRRIDHICDLYNSDLNDSLLAQATVDLEYHQQHQCWQHYYETWMHMVNTYVFMGKVNTALKVVKQMHEDAAARSNGYGMALANYAMGNVYTNMGYIDEAVECYRQSLQLINKADARASVKNDIFSYYSDALNTKQDYGKMAEVTSQWKTFLSDLTRGERSEERKNSSSVWYAYYYLACAQQHLGQNRLDEAEHDIGMAEEAQTDKGEFIPMSVLYYRAQLWLQRKDYEKAYAYNTQRLEKSRGYSDLPSMVLIYEQRAQIMKGLGNYKEAAEMYKNVYELTDSIYKKDARTQINELNTLFRVDEMEMEKRLERNRSITLVVVVIAVALALLLGYWYWTGRRLRRKNEELAVAHAQAEESLRMKSSFIKNISHEIRTPLNILSGFSQLLANDDQELPPDVRREASDNILQNTTRITSLINRLLALADSSSRSLIERTDTVSANQLCQTAIVSCGVADDSSHHFVFESQVDDALTIKTSEQYATQAIGHLLDNARKFTPRGGSISMRCRAERNQLVVTIDDTGCGVPKEKADDIFGEFVQLDEFQDGVGIGLPLSRNIVRQLGGDIVLDVAYTQGARFVITLPL